MSGRELEIEADDLAAGANAAIQDGVDEVAVEGGGTVVLPAGTFELIDAVHLRSGVALIGQGAATVLRKAPSVSSPLADWLGYGHYEVTVERPELFRPGMGVLVEDANAHGFYTTTATIMAVDGDRLFIDRMLNHDYVPSSGGRVVSVFPLVSGYDVEDVRVADLVLDGADDPETITGCRGSGVFLLGAHGATVERVEVRNYNGDAVSFQQCTDVEVRECNLHHNAGGGIHPGSGSVRYVLSGNVVHDNGRDGVFYCLRTTHSLCEGNTIRDNGGAGISIGERDTDHLIRANDVSGSGGPAVVFRRVQFHGGDRVVLEANTFAGNGGDADVVVAPGIRDVTIRGNRSERPAGPAVAIGGGTRGIHLVGNTLNGHDLTAESVSDPDGVASWDERPASLRVGPEAAGPDDTRHLAYPLPASPP